MKIACGDASTGGTGLRGRCQRERPAWRSADRTAGTTQHKLEALQQGQGDGRPSAATAVGWLVETALAARTVPLCGIQAGRNLLCSL